MDGTGTTTLLSGATLDMVRGRGKNVRRPLVNQGTATLGGLPAGDEGAKRVGRVVERSVRFVTRCLKEAQDLGRVTRETPTAILVWMVVGAMRGASSGGPRGVLGGADATGMPPDRVWTEVERLLRPSGEEADR
jgi:hypothetical protein